MAASINDKITQATNGTRPVPTTLTALRAVSAGSISVGALTGWPTATAVHFIIYRIDANSKKVAGSQTDWKGIASGTTISGLVLKGGTDLGDSIGAVVEAAPTAAWCNDLVSWGTQEHNQDGTHAAITATSVTVAAAGDLNAVGVGKLKDNGTSLVTQRSEYFFDYVASGGVWTGDSVGVNRNGSMTAMILYVNGRRISISVVTARAFTASKDTYVDVLDNADGTGTLVYTEVANNAASPALAANSARIAIVVTAAGSIAAATSINQGNISTPIVPVVGSRTLLATDSLGNSIYPNIPTTPGSPATATVAAAQTTATTSYTDLATVGPSVMVRIGKSGCALVIITGLINQADTNHTTYMSFAATGANTVAAIDANAFSVGYAGGIAGNNATGSNACLLTGLTPGLTTFTAKYKTDAGTGSFTSRKIIVIPQ